MAAKSKKRSGNRWCLRKRLCKLMDIIDRELRAAHMEGYSSGLEQGEGNGRLYQEADMDQRRINANYRKERRPANPNG